jgi:hypothetical protein
MGSPHQPIVLGGRWVLARLALGPLPGRDIPVRRRAEVVTPDRNDGAVDEAVTVLTLYQPHMLRLTKPLSLRGEVGGCPGPLSLWFASPEDVPPLVIWYLRHIRSLQDSIVIVNVVTELIPHVAEENRTERRGGGRLVFLVACRSDPVASDQPFVMTGGGGGALGDLPAHAPRLRTVSEAKMKTNNFFIGYPLWRQTSSHPSRHPSRAN